MKVPLLTLDTPNKNNRIYPRAVWEKAVAKYKAEFIDQQRAIITSKPPESETINFNDVVGLVKEIKTEGDTVFAEVIFFPQMEMAQIAADGLVVGALHLRTNGIGKIIKQEDGNWLVEDYELISCFLTNE